MTPTPPDSAIAIAIFDSVTVSIAEDKNGTLRFILFVSFKYFVFDDEDGSEGKRDMYILSFIIGVGFVYLLINYMFYDRGIKSLFKL